MTAGDLVFLCGQYRGATGDGFEVSNSGGQIWSSGTAAVVTTNVSAKPFWCRYNGSWPSNPSLVIPSGTNALTVVMLVFRPSSGSKFWVPDVWVRVGTFTAGTTPFTKTITGITTVRASTVSIAGWFTADDNTWGSLSGTGWQTPFTQKRNLTGQDQSCAFAYKIQTSAGATGDVSQNQLTLGGDAGNTMIMSFAEIDLPSGGGGAGGGYVQSEIAQTQSNLSTISITFGTAVASGNTVIGHFNCESDVATGNGIPILPITDNQGNEYEVIQAIQFDGLAQIMLTFFRPNVTNGPTTITVNLTGNNVVLGLTAHEVSGYDRLGVFNGRNQVGVDPISAGSVTTVENNEYIFGAAILPGGNNNSPWFTWGASLTKREEVGDDVPAIQNISSADRILATAGAIEVTATQTTQFTTAQIMMATLRPVAAAGPGPEILATTKGGQLVQGMAYA